MKIALCLSGQMRAMPYCIDSINIAFPNCDIDVYATAWDHEDKQNIKILQDSVNVVNLNIVNNNELSVNQQFEKEVIRRGFAQVNDSITNWAPIPIWNLIRIETMAQKSFDNINKHYDFIVRSRYDTRFIEDITPLLGTGYLLLTEDIGGSAPWDTWKDTRSVFDGFAAGTLNQMTKYYEFADWLPEYLNYHTETLKAERTMGWYLANIAKIDTGFTRDILGIQVNSEEWYNRSNPIKTDSLTKKQKNTFDFYKEDLQNNHPDVYKEIAGKFK